MAQGHNGATGRRRTYTEGHRDDTERHREIKQAEQNSETPYKLRGLMLKKVPVTDHRLPVTDYNSYWLTNVIKIMLSLYLIGFYA